MVHHADIRFRATSAQAAHARQVVFPLRVRVSRPTSERAVSEAKNVIDQFRQAAPQAEVGKGRLDVGDFKTAGVRSLEELVIEQTSKREARVQLVFLALLRFKGEPDFWDRAAAVARVGDFLQSFSQQPRDKDVEVDVQPAQLLGEGAAETSEREKRTV